jgi:hypothetical protein
MFCQIVTEYAYCVKETKRMDNMKDKIPKKTPSKASKTSSSRTLKQVFFLLISKTDISCVCSNHDFPPVIGETQSILIRKFPAIIIPFDFPAG